MQSIYFPLTKRAVSTQKRLSMLAVLLNIRNGFFKFFYKGFPGRGRLGGRSWSRKTRSGMKGSFRFITQPLRQGIK